MQFLNGAHLCFKNVKLHCNIFLDKEQFEGIKVTNIKLIALTIP